MLDSLMTIPPGGAALDSVTVPVAEVSPTTVEGLTVTEVSDGGLMVSDATSEIEPDFAVMVADSGVATAKVLNANVTEDSPAFTVTLPGTVAFGVLLDSLITIPVFEAAPVKVTVPVGVDPPKTMFGTTVTACKVA